MTRLPITRGLPASGRTNEIRRRRRIVGVFADRHQVVRMWPALGLTVCQVAEGDF